MSDIDYRIDDEYDGEDELNQLRKQLDDLRWQIAQADGYGGYMRHCVRPISFAEWIERRRALVAQVHP